MTHETHWASVIFRVANQNWWHCVSQKTDPRNEAVGVSKFAVGDGTHPAARLFAYRIDY